MSKSLLPTVANSDLFRLMVEENQGMALILLDGDGTILYANAMAEHLRGKAREKLAGKPLASIYKTREEVDQIIQMAQSRGRHDEYGWNARSDGTKYWAHDVFTPLLDKDKGLVGFTMTTYELTRFKQTEQKLRENEQRYRLLVEGVRDYAIFMLDPNGIINSWNEGAKRFKGYEDYEIIGKHFSTFYTAEDKLNGKPARELEIAKATGKYEEEGWRVRKNGSLFWANVVITAMYNERNELTGFSKVTRDLTDRRRTEEMLRASEEQYRLLVNNVKDYGIYMLDTKGRIASWNTGAARIFGYSEEEVVGKNFSIFYPRGDMENDKPALELRVATETGKYEEETWRVRKDGTQFWASILLTAIYNHDKRLIGFAKVTRDLTERKRAENALKASEERLKKVNFDLNRSNQELERFTSVASHDMQEPLRTIRNYLSLVELRLAETATDEVKTFVKRTISAADRMKELILSLLQYSRISSEPTLYDDVVVGDVVTEVLGNLRSAIEDTHAEVHVELDVKLMRGHRIQLVQLFQNLVSNALKFVKDKPPVVTIEGHEEEDRFKFSVSDNGIGIEEKYVQQIFEVFKRLHGKSEYAGSGIGLAICKKIIEHHKGEIWVESVPGKGSTFHFTIAKL
jgi:PAS domain S-box-containing protein